VIQSLGESQAVDSGPELVSLRHQLQEKDQYISHLERDHDKMRTVHDQEERLIVTAWYNLVSTHITMTTRKRRRRRIRMMMMMMLTTTMMMIMMMMMMMMMMMIVMMMMMIVMMMTMTTIMMTMMMMMTTTMTMTTTSCGAPISASKI
jgi:cation transport ATPase